MVAIAWVVSLAVATIGYAWWAQAIIVPIAAAVGLLAGVAMSLLARRRLGGITGDTLGASIEVAFTASIVAMAVSAA
jgi:adenosylcobinamide-GDP ribazoletransferase